MKLNAKRNILSFCISAILVPSYLQATPTLEIENNTAIWTGSGMVHNDSLIESGGQGINNMVIDNVNTENFQQGSSFWGMYYKSAISLGGGNGVNTSDMQYGDLRLSAIHSSIKGTSDFWQWAGLYVRSDTSNATVSVDSNSVIDLTSTRKTDWTELAGILAENKGENGIVNISLSEGSDITITMQEKVNNTEINTGVLAFAEKGKASISAEKNTYITTNGYGLDGIKAWTKEGSVVIHDGTITTNGDSGRGIHSHGVAGGNGKLEVANLENGVITINGKDSIGIKSYNEGNGGVSLYNAGQIYLNENAENSTAMWAQTNINDNETGKIITNVINSGEIYSKGDSTVGIRAENKYDSGLVNIINEKLITLDGKNGNGILANNYQRDGQASTAAINVGNSGSILLGEEVENSTAIVVNNYTSEGDTTVMNDGKIVSNGKNSHAISVTANSNVNLVNSGEITTRHGNGITAATSSGNLNIHSAGKLIVEGEESVGITGIGTGSGMHQIVVHSGSHIEAGKGKGAIKIQSGGQANVTIESGASIHGGAGNGYGVHVEGLALPTPGTTISQMTLNNAGIISSQNDQAIIVNSKSGTNMEINNVGLIEGYLTVAGADTTMNNSGIINLRNLASTQSGLPRDTKSVAIMQFGEGNNTVNHQRDAILQLAEVSGEHKIDDSGSFITSSNRSIYDSGITQGQLLNVNTFNNAGILDLSVNQLAGDLLAITGNGDLTGQSIFDGGTVTSGGGTFISQSGVLILDTVLNAGGENSESDILVVDNAQNGSGSTQVFINNTGGKGELTLGDGIQIVNVLSNADSDAFKLANGSIKAGAYEYTLHQGSLANPQNNSFYLRATEKQINPDVGSYLANQSLAAGLFMHSLHDRLGEPQYTQRYMTEGSTKPAMWIRAVAGNSKGDTAGRAIRQDTNSRILHLGGDLTRWGNDSGDRLHLGVMGAWGRAETVSTSKATGSKSRGNLEGYGLGAYLTWYNEPQDANGLYADLWGMYNWFDNKTDSSRSYDSNSWVASLETGYAITVRDFEKWSLVVEPQGQLSYMHSDTSRIEDNNGMQVDNTSGSGFAGRVGVRTVLKPSVTDNNAKFQPFITANWLYNDAKGSMDFNGKSFSSDMPKHRFEIKVGLQAEVKKDWHIYGQLSGQVGENNYSYKAAQLGIRYNF